MMSFMKRVWWLDPRLEQFNRPGGLVLLAMLVAGLWACSEEITSPEKQAATSAAKGPLSVYVVNYPLRYFSERIGGEHVCVSFPAPADVDPAFWEPDVEQIAVYQQADLILLNGASYAKWVQRASLPESRLVDTSTGFTDRYLSLEEQVTHSHGTGGEHQHGELAFTTWLDPQQAIQQTAAIRDALIRLRPDAKAAFRQGFASLQKDLLELDGQLAAAFAEYKAQPLLFSHPVYQYLIRRYAIDGYELHWEPDSMPSAAEWRAFDELLKRHPARSMVWEGTPTPEIVIALEQRGIETLVFDPAANKPSDGDYLNVMRDNLVRLLRGPR
jgi:zinc transport system substrate-binding protein